MWQEPFPRTPLVFATCSSPSSNGGSRTWGGGDYRTSSDTQRRTTSRENYLFNWYISVPVSRDIDRKTSVWIWIRALEEHIAIEKIPSKSCLGRDTPVKSSGSAEAAIPRYEKKKTQNNKSCVWFVLKCSIVSRCGRPPHARTTLTVRALCTGACYTFTRHRSHRGAGTHSHSCTHAHRADNKANWLYSPAPAARRRLDSPFLFFWLWTRSGGILLAESGVRLEKVFLENSTKVEEMLVCLWAKICANTRQCAFFSPLQKNIDIGHFCKNPKLCSSCFFYIYVWGSFQSILCKYNLI